MGIIKNIRSIFPLPKGWENDSDRKAFGIRIEQTLRDLFARVSRCVTFTKPTAETTLTSDQKAQARSNIGCGGAATYGVKNNLTTTASGYVLDARQGKVLNDAKAEDDEVVHLSGAETITGDKTFSGKLYTDNVYNDGALENHSSSRYCRYRFNNNAGNLGGLIYLDFGNATNQTSNRMTLYEYSPKSTPDAGNTGYAEAYRLPAPAAGLTANKNYDILTTKETVTVAQGGTGATTAADARTNLGLGAAATQAVKNNLTTTASGYVLDARQGPVITERILKAVSEFTYKGLTFNISRLASICLLIHITGTTSSALPSTWTVIKSWTDSTSCGLRDTFSFVNQTNYIGFKTTNNQISIYSNIPSGTAISITVVC